jgi:pimeloyl-ACP methyl ester carboxylesterase
MTMVLLPPVGLDDSCWRWLDLPDVAAIKYVYPGFGTRARGDFRLTLDSLADEVVTLADGPLDLVGVSMGAMVAQHAAIRHPHRVRSMLLACSGAAAHPSRSMDQVAAVEQGGMKGVLDSTLSRWFRADTLAESPTHPGVAYVTATLLGLDPRSFADAWRAIAAHDVADQLARVSVPTTCIAASDDSAAPVTRMRLLAESLPEARLVMLSGSHMVHLENPLDFSRVLAEHLTRHASRGSSG